MVKKGVELRNAPNLPSNQVFLATDDPNKPPIEPPAIKASADTSRKIEPEFRTIKPDLKKVFIKNLVIILTSVLSIILLLLFLNWQIGLDVLVEVLSVLNMAVDSMQLMLDIIILLVVAGGAMLIGNYLVEKNVRYEIYKDKILFYETTALVFIGSREIPFQNIVKISYSREGMIDKILDSGTIILDLTGMKDTSVKLEFINDTEKTVQYLQNLVREYSQQQQMRYTERQIMNNPAYYYNTPKYL